MDTIPGILLADARVEGEGDWREPFLPHRLFKGGWPRWIIIDRRDASARNNRGQIPGFLGNQGIVRLSVFLRIKYGHGHRWVADEARRLRKGNVASRQPVVVSYLLA